MRSVLLLAMLACLSSEESEAESIFLQQVQDSLEENRPYQDAIQGSSAGQQAAAAIVDCLDTAQVAAYALELSVMVHADGLRLVDVAGAAPLLNETIQQACLQDALAAVHLPVNPVLAAATTPVFESHALTLFRAGSTPPQVTSAPVLLLQVSDQIQRKPMALVSDTLVMSNTPWTQQVLPAALLACESLGLPAQADPMLLAFRLVHPGQPSEPAACHLQAGMARSPYTDCVCDAFEQHLDTAAAMPGIEEVTISAVTEDGRTVASTVATTPTASMQQLWLLRHTEDGETRYRHHTFQMVSPR